MDTNFHQVPKESPLGKLITIFLKKEEQEKKAEGLTDAELRAIIAKRKINKK